MTKPKLSVLLAQYDRAKYRPALAAVIRMIAGLRSVEPMFVVVDNREAGDWVHEVSDSLVHIGGDNRAHEFSAFDKGVDYLQQTGRSTDMYVLVTDALLADGREFLDLVDDNVTELVGRLQACVGWMDSFGQECQIGHYRYSSWMRTSLAFVPASRLPVLRPLAADLGELELFTPRDQEPFADDARISSNLKGLILEWLTTDSTHVAQLSDTWHSRFDLTPAMLPFFRAKASAILREHLCSARLKSAGTPCYDFRALRKLASLRGVKSFIEQGGNPSWQWLGWRDAMHCDPTEESDLSEQAESAA